MWQLVRFAMTAFWRWCRQEQGVVDGPPQTERRLHVAPQIGDDHHLLVYDAVGIGKSTIGRQGDVYNTIGESKSGSVFVENERSMGRISNRNYNLLGSRLGFSAMMVPTNIANGMQTKSVIWLILAIRLCGWGNHELRGLDHDCGDKRLCDRGAVAAGQQEGQQASRTKQESRNGALVQQPHRASARSTKGRRWQSFRAGSRVDRLFFADFKEFAHVANWWLADQFTKSRFRLQDLPDGDMSLNVDFDGGPTLGRCFALYYNQTHIGRIEIHPSYDYTTENPNVYTDIRIEWSRFLGSYELMQILRDIAMHVTSNNPKSVESLAAQQSIHYALTETLWGEYRISQYDRHLGDVEDWGGLNVSFHGVAEFYMQRKNAPASKN